MTLQAMFNNHFWDHSVLLIVGALLAILLQKLVITRRIVKRKTELQLHLVNQMQCVLDRTELLISSDVVNEETKDRIIKDIESDQSLIRNIKMRIDIIDWILKCI